MSEFQDIDKKGIENKKIENKSVKSQIKNKINRNIYCLENFYYKTTVWIKFKINETDPIL